MTHRPGQFHEPCRDLGRALGVPLPNGLLVVDEMTVDAPANVGKVQEKK